MNWRKAFFIGKITVASIAILALVIWGVMLLWNWLVPELFNGPVITYWQSAGILLLSKIIFSGFHKHGHDKSKHDYWRRKFMKNLTPEQKEKFKTRMEEKWRGEDLSDPSHIYE